MCVLQIVQPETTENVKIIKQMDKHALKTLIIFIVEVYCNLKNTIPKKYFIYLFLRIYLLKY